MKVLEEDVEQSLLREENRLDAEEQCYPDNVQKVVQELKSKHNVSKSPVSLGHISLIMEPARDRATTKTHE